MTEDADQGASGHLLSWIGLLIASLAMVMVAGAITGFSVEAIETRGGFNGRTLAILGGMVALLILLGLLCWRLTRRLFGPAGDVPRRERMSRNVMIGSGMLGGLIGGLLAAFGRPGSGGSAAELLSNGPIPPTLAIILCVVTLGIVPLISLYWHRVIDEHERSAYRDGAVAGTYVYMLGAPAWWLLWRGGLAPEPDGVAIYLIFTFLVLIVWFWKKYR